MRAHIEEKIEKIRNNEVPNNYIRIKKYIIPNSWRIDQLGEYEIKIGSGKTPKGGEKNYVDKGINFIRSQNVLNTKLDMSKICYIRNTTHKEMQSSAVKANDILLNITGGSIGRSCIVPKDIGEANLNQHVCIIRTKESIKNEFLLQFLLSEFGQKQIMLFQAGGNREGLNFEQIRSLNIVIPPIEEQVNISNIISTWDKAIELKEQIIEEMKKQKTGLMQKLLTGKVRLPGFDGDWEIKKASQIFINVSDKKHGGIGEVLSASQENGIMPRSEIGINIKYDKKSLSSYKRVMKGDYIISLRSFQGGIEFSEYEGLVSPAYTVLRNKLDVGLVFYKSIFKSIDFISRLNGLIYGIRDGKQIGYKDFKVLELPYPEVKEQEAIGTFFELLDKEITLLIKELEALKQQKKGLMQLLLTGIIRVNTN